MKLLRIFRILNACPRCFGRRTDPTRRYCFHCILVRLSRRTLYLSNIALQDFEFRQKHQD